MDNVGILLRGKSLEKLPLIIDKFNRCYIVNDFKKEISLVGEYIKDKDIIQYSNSMIDAMLVANQYKKFNINEVNLSFTKSMFKNKYNIVNEYKKRGVEKVSFLADQYEQDTRGIHNTGVCCIFYVSEVIKPKKIWMVGLEFYLSDYLVKKNYPHQLQKTKKINLVDSFIKIVKDHPNIEYNIVTYFKELPKLDNLNIMGIK
jgi:hypothetical protein